MMSDGTMVATGQMMGMNMMNAIKQFNDGKYSATCDANDCSNVGSNVANPSTSYTIYLIILSVICNCPAGFTRIPPDSGNCYLVCDSNSDWLGAVFECRNRGAYLWEPNNDAEVKAVGQALLDSTSDKFWTGATDQGNEKIPTFALGSGNSFTVAAESNGVNSDCVSYEPTKCIYRTCPTSRKCVCERVSLNKPFKVLPVC
ncbi:unnamed protein product [Mytilus coruscus]|uniref:C-type lectin domain-containing protein n=1 Tax=Mytilus coruscus TaxID=42192 RepID=A0A6J8CHZ3_MYTCO|nr:unnamed protein product [Mytilus coruscus]